LFVGRFPVRSHEGSGGPLSSRPFYVNMLYFRGSLSAAGVPAAAVETLNSAVVSAVFLRKRPSGAFTYFLLIQPSDARSSSSYSSSGPPRMHPSVAPTPLQKPAPSLYAILLSTNHVGVMNRARSVSLSSTRYMHVNHHSPDITYISFGYWPVSGCFDTHHHTTGTRIPGRVTCCGYWDRLSLSTAQEVASGVAPQKVI
jgi:hypothetical protein